MCFGTVSGVFGLNSNLRLLPRCQQRDWELVCQRLDQNQLEAAYSTGEVMEVEEKEGKGVGGYGWV